MGGCLCDLLIDLVLFEPACLAVPSGGQMPMQLVVSDVQTVLLIELQCPLVGDAYATV